MEEQDRLLKFKRDMEKLGLAPVKSEEYVSPLNDAVNVVKGAYNPNINNKMILKGATEKIDTKPVQKLLSGVDFQDKIQAILKSRAAAKMGKNTLKSIPVIGGLVGMGSSLMSGDVAAAGLDAADVAADLTLAPTNPVGLATTAISAFSGGDLGSDSDSLEAKMESGTATPDELYRLRNGMK